MPRNPLGSPKHIIEILHSRFMPFNMGLVPQSKLSAHFRCAGIISKKDHFNIRMKQFPTPERISLNHSAVARKRFPGGKKCQHYFALFFDGLAKYKTSEVIGACVWIRNMIPGLETKRRLSVTLNPLIECVFLPKNFTLDT